MSKNDKLKIQAGKLALSDLSSTKRLYITGADRHYTDSSMGVTPYGQPYDKGRPIPINVQRSLEDYFFAFDKEIRDNEFDKFSRLPVDELYTKLMKMEHVGAMYGVLLCIALQDRVPDVKHLFASEIHTQLFCHYTVCPYDKDQVSTLRDPSVARKAAECTAKMLLRDTKIRKKPSVEEVVELALKNTLEVDGLIGDTEIVMAEKHLYELAMEIDKVDAPEIPVDEYTSSFLCDEQLDSFREFTSSDRRIDVLQGPPGTGKSHYITALVRAYRLYTGVNPLVLSYTNKACMNLTERLQDYVPPHFEQVHRVMTINSAYYRMVNMKVEDQHVFRDVQLIIVDESSTVSSEVLDMLLYVYDRCGANCKILFVGDVYQLPPVAAYGTPFQNLVRMYDANGIPYAKFKDYHRGNEEIWKGFRRMKDAGEHTIAASKSISIATAGDVETAEAIVSQKYAEAKRGKTNLGCICETNAIADRINIASVKRLFDKTEDEFVCANKWNPNRPFIHILLQEGLRIVADDNLKESKQCSEDIAKSEFATILSVGALKSEILLDRGPTIKLTNDLILNSFKLGYATTVHKYQGSEADEIIYVLQNSDNMVGNAFYSQKELKYVGLSRSKKKLDILALERGTIGWRIKESINLVVTDPVPAKMCF